MSKQIKTWGWPALAFLAAGMVAVLAGPSMGSIARLRVLQGATDFCGCGDDIQGPSGGASTGQSAASFTASGAPVDYARGQNLMAVTEFDAKGPRGWTHRRSIWGLNGSETLAGPGWKVSGLLQLISEGTGMLSVVNGSTSVRTFQDNGNGTFTPLNWYKDTLTVNSGDFYTLTDVDGNRWIFRGFNSTWTPSSLFGKLYSSSDAYGNSTSTTYGGSGVTNGKILQIDQFPTGDPNNGTRVVYAYNLAGVAAGYLSGVTYQRVVASAASTVRQVNYTYYLSSGSNGNAAQLQWSQVTDGTNVLDTYYHRYATASPGTPPRLMLGPVAYERAKAALGSDAAIDAASDTTLSAWADYTFAYNTFFPSGSSVGSETVQGTGCSCGSGGGTGTFTFSYTNASHGLHGVNVWNQKTIETLPDGNQNIVYTDDGGATLLQVFKNVSTGQQWATYHQYDSQRREILTAMPSAVISYDESQASLGVSLQASSGLFYLYGFYATTDLANGAVAGYRSTISVRQGTGGAANLISQTKYTSHTDGSGATVYPVSSLVQYRNSDGTGAITTSFSYSWHPSSNQILERVATFPAALTTQNGSGSSTVAKEQYDILGRPIWEMDQDGYINATEYDSTTGGVTKQIRDVNTTLVSNEPAGWVTPADGGLHLVTQYVLDSLGRATKVTDPLGQINYAVYKDSSHEVRVYPGWISGTNTPTGPTQMSREDRAGGYLENLTMSAAPAVLSGVPTGSEAVSNLQSLSRTYLDIGYRPSYVDSYFNFTGLTYSTAPNIGTQGTHFYRASSGYDVRGRNDRNVAWDGTITRKVFDTRGRTTSTWIGTDDTPTSGDWSPSNTAGTNLVKATDAEFDSGGVGDGNLTRSRTYTSAVDTLDTFYQYDFRDRILNVRAPDKVATKSTYDNLDRVTMTETYWDTDTNFVIAASELRGRTETRIDERGQVYQTVIHYVDAAGTVGNHLTTNTWYNARRMVVKAQDPNGLFKKMQYDGAGRKKATFVSFDASETTYAQAFDVAGDSVVDESVPTYDAAGNVLYTTRYQRSSSGSVPAGDLASGWAVGNSRRTFVASWYDLANRLTSAADYGNNGDVSFTRPATAPAPNGSSSILVTKFEYDAGGRQDKTTNNLAKISQKTFDGLSRVTRIVEDFVNGAAAETELDTDRITDTVYDSVGRLSQKIAYNPKGTGLGVESQITQYVYGTVANQASPAVYRNDLLAAEIYPDSDDTYTPGNPAGSQLGNGADAVHDRVEYTYDYASRRATLKDQRQSVHTYTYAAQGSFGAGQLWLDTVTTLGPGVDGSVQNIYHAYDTLGRLQGTNSYADTGVATLVNFQEQLFDGWGNPYLMDQRHTGTAPSVYVQVAYDEGAVSGEAKYVRPMWEIYPNNREVHYKYSTAGSVADRLSRLDSVVSDFAGTVTFAQYTYLGMGTVVRETHPGVTGGLTLDYGIDTGSPAGWDRFGRVIDHKWGSTADANKFDRFQHTYNNVNQRLTSDRTYTAAPTNRDEQYTYDNLHRLINMKRGTLSGGTIANNASTLQIDWNALDALGNWRSWRWDLNGGNPQYITQGRSHNKANEIDVNDNDADAAGASITQTAGAGTTMNWVDPQYEKSGSMKNGPKPGDETTAASRLHYTYDAWERLVKVQADSSGAPGTTIAEYQYDGIHRRIAKLKPNGANWDRVDYYYNHRDQVVEERTATALANKTTVATVPKYQWVWDPRYIDAPIFRDENKDGDGDCVDGTDERLYFVQDANFNTTALVTVAGAVVERYAYNPYGAVSIFTAAWATQAPTVYNNAILFAGYRQDAETQLYHARRRVYHPTLGRFLQRDPDGYHDGMNKYEYVMSDPYMRLDPSGLGTLYLGIPPLPPKKNQCKKEDKGLGDVPNFRRRGGTPGTAPCNSARCTVDPTPPDAPSRPTITLKLCWSCEPLLERHPMPTNDEIKAAVATMNTTWKQADIQFDEKLKYVTHAALQNDKFPDDCILGWILNVTEFPGSMIGATGLGEALNKLAGNTEFFDGDKTLRDGRKSWNTANLARTWAHEIGHSLGLGHSKDGLMNNGQADTLSEEEQKKAYETAGSDAYKKMRK